MADTKRCVTAPLAEGCDTDIVAHALNGQLHLRPHGFFAPMCGMRKAVKDTGLKATAWRQAKGNYCVACERAAKFFGYLQ